MKGKRFLAVAASMAMVASILPQSLVVSAAETEYKIYPTPHSIEYDDEAFALEGDVSVIIEDGIDEVTENKVAAVLEENGLTMKEASKTGNGANILVGVYGSGDYVDAYAEENMVFDAATFDGFDAYVLDVDAQNDTIVILGKDTDAAFYGVVSLMHILDQSPELEVRGLTIEDYADTSIRGFIEGYYGIPWSNEDRMSLMEFGGQFKMTSYVFAPKDDPYHTSKWRQLYPAEEIEAIAEMVAVGNANKCRFVWTAHPFMGGFNSNAVDSEIASLLAKFEQLYSVGVRQFGVLGDDVGSLNKDIVIRVMEAVSEWAAEKGDVYDSVFCPAGYNHSWQGNYSELNTYDAGFPDDVQIFWTGEAVCQPVEVKTLDHFRNFNATNGQRRAPLFWLNWPVNDINMSRLMMGKGSLLRTDVNPDDLVGVVTNPMQDAECSKVSLFAVADYTWNIADFDDDQSWADCFQYVDPDASEELHTLAKHMSDPSPNGHGLNLAESEELKPLMDAYYAKLENGTATDEDHDAMIAEFEEIAAACVAYHEKSQNEDMKEELLPFTNSLKDRAEAAIALINTQKGIEANNASKVWTYYSEAIAEMAASESHQRPTRTGTQTALPASKHVTPFVTNVNKLLAPTVNAMIDDSGSSTGVIEGTGIYNEDNMVIRSGNLGMFVDDNTGDYTGFAHSADAADEKKDSIVEGAYVGLAFNKVETIGYVEITQGSGDHIEEGTLEYQKENGEWVELGSYTNIGEVFTASFTPVNAKAVRLVNDKEIAKWWRIYEFDVLPEGKTEDPSGLTLKPFDNGKGVYDGKLSNVADGKTNTYIWYASGGAKGDYIGVELDREVKLGEISLIMDGGDHFTNYSLQYSTDGKNYTTYETYTTSEMYVNLSAEDISAKYVRFYNNANSNNWVKVFEISVGEQIIRTDAIFTNMSDLPAMTIKVEDAKAELASSEDITFAPGDYLGIRLDRIKDISAITAEGADGLTLETSLNDIIWTAVEDEYEDARYIRLINNTDKDITVSYDNLIVESYEISGITVEATNFAQEDTHLKAFDQDRTTEAVLQASQYAGKYITYDLGQVIDLESLKLVLHDGTTDYPRHAVVSVSEDGETWEEAMVIGNQDSNNVGEAENTDDIKDLFPDHEISYYTKSVDGIDKEVRYIKFEITRNKAGADKWVRIREIEINGGNFYLPSENNPTILLDGEESTGNVPTLMIDGDVSTTFQSAVDADGSFTFRPSENTNIQKITVLQSPATISGAKVNATVVDADGKIEIVELGSLSTSLVEFNTSSFENVLDITVVWTEGNVPKIHEILLSGNTPEAADKAELEAYYAEVKDTDTANWTEESAEAFEAALAAAKAILDSDYATPNGVNTALAELRDAVEGKVVVEPPTWVNPFKDVAEGKWYYDAVAWGNQNGVVNGLKADVFGVKENCTRGQIVTFIWRAMGEPAAEAAAHNFTDVVEGKYYYDAMLWAVENGIVTGLTDTTFGPEATCTRQEIATLLYRLAGEPEVGTDIPFSDIVAGKWYTNAVIWAAEDGVVTGYDNGTFGRKDNVSREQTVTMLYRYFAE